MSVCIHISNTFQRRDLRMVVYTFNLSTGEADAGGSISVGSRSALSTKPAPGQPGLNTETNPLWKGLGCVIK